MEGEEDAHLLRDEVEEDLFGCLSELPNLKHDRVSAPRDL